MQNTGYTPLFELTRGGIVESIHFGAATVVDSTGRLLGAAGNPLQVTFLRSTAKPFQAMPFVENGGPAHFGFTVKETALICASHSGSDDHVQTAASIQAKAGFTEHNLQCGVHLPADRAARSRLMLAGEEPSQNQHNCSGKHSGMLACTRLMDWPMESYLEPDHPLQQEILKTLADFSDLRPDQITIGIDGCSAPNFALPLYNAALAFARLAGPVRMSERRTAACHTITHAMTQHPTMIAGSGEFDTRLMEVGAGRWVSKGGAEGYQGIGLLPGVLGVDSPGIGIALKISDGSLRDLARSAVSLEILRQLGVLSEADLQQLENFGPRIRLKNFRGLQVGDTAPCFDIRTTR